MSRKRKSGGVKLTSTMQQCMTILKMLQSKQDAQPFLEPVDWELYDLKDYPEIIKKPMDLGTIEEKLTAGKYSTPEKFASDVKLVWQNAQKYNRPDSEIYITADKLSKIFDKKFMKIKKATKRKREDGKGETREVTRADQLRFSQLVSQLSSEKLTELVDMIKRDSPAALNDEDEVEIEIEIAHIEPATLLALTAFATKCVNKQGSKKLRK